MNDIEVLKKIDRIAESVDTDRKTVAALLFLDCNTDLCKRDCNNKVLIPWLSFCVAAWLSVVFIIVIVNLLA